MWFPLVGPVALLQVSLTFLLATRCLADNFINPTSALRDLSRHFKFGETYTISWTTELKYITLRLHHWSGDGENPGRVVATLAGALSWTVGDNDNVTLEEIAQDPAFHFIVTDGAGRARNEDGTSQGAQIRGFIIYTTTVFSGSTLTRTAASPVPTQASATQTPLTQTPSTQTPAPVVVEGLGEEVKIVLGVGIGIGVPVLVAAAVVIAVVVMRRRNGGNAPTPGAAAVTHGDKPPGFTGSYRNELSSQQFCDPATGFPGYPYVPSQNP
ncbi:hypothetical protein QBC39DRAFT_431238 [Podospora conica]|nr:hypothetical protein QBC39DRAFT_431238 [Schizothecium conicum]